MFAVLTDFGSLFRASVKFGVREEVLLCKMLSKERGVPPKLDSRTHRERRRLAQRTDNQSVGKFYAQFNNIMAVLGKYNNEIATVHLTNSYCVVCV